jgi:hypothetical protein
MIQTREGKNVSNHPRGQLPKTPTHREGMFRRFVISNGHPHKGDEPRPSERPPAAADDACPEVPYRRSAMTMRARGTAISRTYDQRRRAVRQIATTTARIE